MNCLSSSVNGCIIRLPHIIVIPSNILISTRFNKTSIRYSAINTLLAMVDNMSVICCTSFIYSLVAIYSLIVYHTNNISSKGRHHGRGIYQGRYQ
ncbi:Uncharacterised protein [Shigella sonnei]|nr:Uncharacterised protein [Shigella sonnei]CSI43677.1 Uncharacterised protein [Shigella sonnei]CSP79151.1 Uncharacterised protein [Shigella sonnei]CSQ02595.1 Uncharacterised protein [Shigella sonnei]CSQ82240.1 Uncharacterised protein [Shigella sonnei]